MIRRLIAAILLLAVPETPGAAQAQRAVAPREPIPLAVFARLPETDRPRINTDGTALAAKIRVNGEAVLSIIPLDTPGARPMLIARDGEFDQRDDVRTTNWQWIDPDNLIIWISSRTDVDGQRVDATRVIAYNRQTRRTTRLGWEGTFLWGSDVLWMSRSGPPRLLLARLAAGRGYERLGNEEVIEVDVTTGRQRLVMAPRRGVRDWSADGDGNLRLGTSYDRDSGRFQALYRADGGSVFHEIIGERVDRRSRAPIPQVFLPGEKALVRSRRSGFYALYEMDLRTMELGRQVFGVEGYDVEGDIDTNDEANALERVTVIRDRREDHWFSPRMREIQTVLDESFGTGNAIIVSYDRPRENLVVHVGAANQAGAYYLYQTVTGDMRLIGWRNSALRDMALNPVRTIRYRASDGQTIPAVLTLPRLREARNLPLIVLPHGGPGARDSEEWDLLGWTQALAELGYAVIQPNFRGSIGFGQAWEALADGGWGTRMQDDLNDAITHLAAEGIADPRRVCIMGWSYGGYAASRAAQRDGDKYRCAISGAGVHDIPDMLEYDRDYLGAYASRYLDSAAESLASISPGRFARDYSVPILIIHGARDQRVPVSQSRNLVDRLRRAGKVDGRDFVYLEQPRNTHNLPLEEDRLQILEAVQRFLAQHNPAN